jgi:AraC-like DNA-binding protein
VLPHAAPQLVVRFTVSAGVDVHVLGARAEAHRKRIRGGQRAVIAQLRVGAHPAVLGAAPAQLRGRIVPLDELWGTGPARTLTERLRASRDVHAAATVLDEALAARSAGARPHCASVRLAVAAAHRLESASIGAVAAELGASERSLRRAFHDAVGMGPKAYAKLTRFHRALAAARGAAHVDWARIAVEAGYFDQSHLITDFRQLTGVTPRALLGELLPRL